MMLKTHLLLLLSFAVCVSSCSKKASSEQIASAAKPAPAKAQAEEGCLHEEKKPEIGGCGDEQPPADLDKEGRLGQPFGLDNVQPLSVALTQVPESKTVLVSGKIESVCQKKRCWLVLEDQDARARVMVKDGSFAFPFGAKGRSATIEGVLELRRLSKANVKHLRADGDADIKGEEPRNEYFIYATGAQLR